MKVRNLLIAGAVGLLGFMAYQEYMRNKKRKCNCQDNEEEVTLLDKAEQVPDRIRQVFDANVASHFRTYFNRDSVKEQPAFGAGNTDDLSTGTAQNLVYQS